MFKNNTIKQMIKHCGRIVCKCVEEFYALTLKKTSIYYELIRNRKNYRKKKERN